MTANEMIKRAKIVSGESVNENEVEDEDLDRSDDSHSEDDVPKSDDLSKASNNRREKNNELIYNESDHEEKTPIKRPAKNIKKHSKPKINIFDMVKDSQTDQNETINTQDSFEIDSEDIRHRLAELQDSDESENESNEINNSKINRKRLAIVDSDTDSDDGQVTSQNKLNESDNNINTSTEHLTKNTDNDLTQNRAKRDRSDSEDSLPGEGFLSKKKKTGGLTRKQAVINDDDDEDDD